MKRSKPMWSIGSKFPDGSTGRIIGFKCTPPIRYPVSKKTYSKPKKQQQTA